MKISSYLPLLDDPDVKRWHSQLSQTSPVTAWVYLRRLGWMGKTKKLSPKELASMPSDDIDNMIMDFIEEQGRAGKAGSYTQSVVKAIKSWRRFRRVPILTDFKIMGASDTPSLRDQEALSQEKLARVFNAADLRTKVALGFIAHAGVRPEVLGGIVPSNGAGTKKDGLVVRDITDMEIKDGKVSFTKMPVSFLVRKAISKAGHQYVDFIGEETAKHLAEYLEYRMRGGEKVGPDSPIIIPKNGPPHFIATGNVSDAIRKAIRAAGINVRTYQWRTYFSTQLLIGVSKEWMAEEVKVFIEGHSGTIENRYTTNRQNLPPELIEEMRESYRKCCKLLETTSIQGEASREEISGWVLKMFGFTDEEVVKLKERDPGEMWASVMPHLQKFFQEHGQTEQCVVQASIDFKPYFREGWTIKMALPPNQVVLERRNALYKDFQFPVDMDKIGKRRGDSLGDDVDDATGVTKESREADESRRHKRLHGW